jgi:uncharacterized protein
MADAVKESAGDTGTGDATGFTLVDCDVHPIFPEGLNTIHPYITSAWAKKLGLAGQEAWKSGSGLPGVFGIPTNSIYTSLDGPTRLDAIPDDGQVPASTPELIAKYLLDPWKIDRGVLVQGNIFGLGAIPNADVAFTIAQGTNGWLADKWVGKDDRLRYAVVVAPQDPVRSAAEIRERAAGEGAIEVLLPANRKSMGDPFLHPIYDAASECGLPVVVHPTAVESIYVNGPQIGQEPAWYYMEWRAGLGATHMVNAASLVAHGVFEKFPDLKIIFSEVGYAWLLELMWKMDKDFKALRDETPWLKRMPSEYMLDHFRFTTQPWLEPRTRKELLDFCEMIDAERTLLFSTDFPHWDGDDPNWTLKQLPDHLRSRIAAESAVELYGDRLL